MLFEHLPNVREEEEEAGVVEQELSWSSVRFERARENDEGEQDSDVEDVQILPPVQKDDEHHRDVDVLQDVK